MLCARTPGILQRNVPRFVDAPIAGAPATACIGMAPAKMKRKESQALEEAATATSIGVGNIASIALQNEISDITERLSSDPQLAFTLGSLLRDGTLVSMLKGGDYDKDVKAVEKAAKNKGWRSRSLRSTAKTMKHLPTTCLAAHLDGLRPHHISRVGVGRRLEH